MPSERQYLPNRTQPANILEDMMGECRQVGGRCKETLKQSFLISVLYWSCCEDRAETCVPRGPGAAYSSCFLFGVSGVVWGMCQSCSSFFQKELWQSPETKSAAACANGMAKTCVKIIKASVRQAKLERCHRTAGEITGLYSLKKVLKWVIIISLWLYILQSNESEPFTNTV